MFDNTPLEIIHGAIFLLSLMAKGGLLAAVPVVVDQIVSLLSGHHIVPLVLAGITGINLANLRNLFYAGKYSRPIMYKGRRRMTMSADRMKARFQKEIDAIYDEAWFHNVNLDLAADRVNWNWL